MLKVGFNQERIFKWLERELTAVLAVGIVGFGSLWAMAGGSATTTMSLTILPAGGETITVTDPDGGESWQIGSTQNVTWTATASILNVRIELQREVAGAWEDIIASTSNDGSYPWNLSGATTTTATVRISKVGDATVNDSSNAVFSITAASGGGGGGGPSMWPGIDNVVPNIISNTTATVVSVTGSNFDPSIKARLNSTDMLTEWLTDKTLKFTVPARFPAGMYNLSVYDSIGRNSTWGSLVWVVSGPAEEYLPPGVPKPPVVTPPTPTPVPPVNLYYASRLVGQSDQNIKLTMGQSVTVWAEFKNTGTLPWENFGKNPVRIGTSSPRDRLSKFKPWTGWVLKNRPANVARPGASGRQTIKPGEIGRFTFTLRAPGYLGSYTELFGTVVEFRQWMQEGAVRWNITVAPRAGQKPATVVPKTTAPPQVTVPVVELPEAPVFYDGIEGWLKSFTSFFGQLFSGFGRF